MNTVRGIIARSTCGGIALASILLAGCDRAGTAGGPGATDKGAKAPMYGEADNTFNLTTSSISIKQGDTEKGMIGIKRGTNFDQDVGIMIDDLPKGVTLESSKLVIKSGATDVNFTLTASNDSTPGDFNVKVTGHPAKGGDAVNNFKLTVAKKDSFTLSMPFWTTAIKQGEAKSVSITIKRDKRFDQDVTVKVDSLPKGITLEPASAIIKTGESDAKFVLKAADDAGLGDFAVMVTGHPTMGADATHEFKFSVAKK